MRVSTVTQNDERQRIELEKQGIEKKHIYSDKQSGKNFERPQYQKLRKKLKPGDVMVVKSLDRLGRNYKEIQVEWRYLLVERGIDIVVMDMPVLDTRRNKDLLGTLISDIVLGLLSYVAQAERENMLIRQAEGIAVAKAKGVKFGRPRKAFPQGFDEVYEDYAARVISKRDACLLLEVSSEEFCRCVNRLKKWEKRNTNVR